MRAERWIYTLPLRLRSLFRRQAADRELDEELQYHVDLKTEENIAKGMTPQEARRASRIQLGGIEQVKECVREVRTGAWLDSLFQDVRFGLRMLRKTPGFTAVAVLTLALGIGANTAIFSVTYGILLKPLPFPSSSHVVQIWGKSDRTHDLRVVYISGQDFREIQQHAHSFEQVATYLEAGVTLVGEGDPESLQSTLVSGNFFSVLGVEPLLGRPILPEDDQPGDDQVAILSYELWQRRFGGDSKIVGKKISIVARPLGSFRGSPNPPKPYAVIGVLPAIFPFPNRGQILVPESSWENITAAHVVARLKDGTSLRQANAELQAISASLASEYPKTEKGLSLSVTTLRERITEDYTTGLLILLSAVGFLLLLACINVGSLLIARSWARQGEIAIREALGATRRRLLRQFLTESVLLALLGGVLGVPIAFWGVDLLRALAPAGTPRVDEIGLNWVVLCYTLGVSLLSGVLFGFTPVLFSSRVGPTARLKGIMMGSSEAAFTRSPYSLPNILIIAEISLSFLLVTASGLAARGLWKLTNVDMGFHPAHVLTMWVNFSSDVCPKPDTCNLAMKQVLDRVVSLAGVQNAAFGNWQPLSDPFGWLVQIPGISDSVPIIFQQVTPQYFETIGIPVLKGRSFGVGDTLGSPLVAIVNAAMAKNYFDGNPLGKPFSMGKDKSGRPISLEIVGEVGDTRDISPTKRPVPAFYIPYSQSDSMFLHALIVRAWSNPLQLLPAIREQVWVVDKNAPVPGAETMDQIISESIAEPRFQTLLLGAFGGIALLLAVVGIYGVVSYSLAQRTHEMGIRLALGGQPRDILHLVLGEGVLVAAKGIVIGVALALGLTRYLGSLLFEIKPYDPATFFGVALVLLATALLACYIPARRAMKMDPMVALRHE